MGAYTRGTLTAIAYRGDTLEVTELGLERGIRYVIKGARGGAGAAGQRPADRRGKTASLNGSTASIWQSATLCDAARPAGGGWPRAATGNRRAMRPVTPGDGRHDPTSRV